MPAGKAPQPGEVLRQRDLHATLRALAAAESAALKKGVLRSKAIDAVRDYFYRGDIARRIDAFSKANGGLLRYEDMAAFRLRAETPVSTTYRGFEVYKPGFWSQGPSMIEALNVLEAFTFDAHNSPEYIHQVTEALKLAYADRDTYYGDPAFSEIPQALLTKDYAAERRKLIGPRASLEFLPGAPGGKKLPHPGSKTRILEASAARDTTCVNAIDRDGIMFSATPSGAWLPSVIAGDTGIPLTQRGQSFLLVEGSPNELAGGKRPRITLSPTLVTRAGEPYVVLSTPGGDNQDQALLQVLLNILEFGMNPQRAIEAPRFQTRHLVSSFDNHGMNPGDLLLDERIAPETSAALGAKGHKVSSRPRFASGSAPVAVRVAPGGVIEAGADPYAYRVAHAW
jgi:gamma-glutamyltranspeptidase/glutathione hydrolase